MLPENFEVDAVRGVHVVGVRRIEGKRIILERLQPAPQRPVLRHVECHFPGIDASHGRLVLVVGLYSRHAVVPLLRHHREHQDNGNDTQRRRKHLITALEPQERAHRDEPYQRSARLTSHGGRRAQDHGDSEKAAHPHASRGELQIAKQGNGHDQGKSHLVIASDEAPLRSFHVVDAAIDDGENTSFDAVKSDRHGDHPHQLVDPLLALHEHQGDKHHELNLPYLIEMRPREPRIHRLHRREQYPGEKDQQDYAFASPRNFLRLAGHEQGNQRDQRDDHRERHVVREGPGQPMRIHEPDPGPYQHADMRPPEDERQGAEDHQREDNISHYRSRSG